MGKRYHLALLIAAAVMATGPVSADTTVSTDDNWQVNVTADEQYYTCSPDCTAYVNISNGGPINGTLDNFTITNGFSFDASSTSVGLDRRDNGSYTGVGTATGEQDIEVAALAGEPIRNGSGNGDASVFRFRVNLSDPGIGKWNTTARIGWDNGTSHLESFTLDPYLQEIRLERPDDGNITTNERPGFNFTYYSATNASLDCAVRADQDGINRVTHINTTSNATSQRLITNSTFPFSHGSYSWHTWCDSDADQDFDDGELSVNRSISIDRQGPTISTTQPVSDANASSLQINTTVQDEFIGVNHSSVQAALGNGTANYSSGGSTGWTALSRDGTTDLYTLDFDLAGIADGDYTLWIRANDTFGQQRSNTTSITVDTAPPDVGYLDINASSNATNITQQGIFALNTFVTDQTTAVSSCTVSVVDEAAWNGGSYSTNATVATFNTSLGYFQDTANTTADLRSHEGNVTFDASCLDAAGNSGTNHTLNITAGTLAGTQQQWFPFDSAGPHIVTASLSTANESFVNDLQPTITFNISDFTGIAPETVRAWFNGSVRDTQAHTFNYTRTLYNANRTIRLSFDPNGSLTEAKLYNVSVTADDIGDDYLHNGSFHFTPDVTAPSMDGTTTTDSGTDRDGNTWYDNSVSYNLTCSDGTAGMESYSIEGSSSSDSDDGSGTTITTTNGSAEVSFSADSGVEKSFSLDLTCTDAAGNGNTTTQSARLDDKHPQLNGRQPVPGSSTTKSLPFTQTVNVEVVDNGIGFSESDLNEFVSPTFGGQDISDSFSVSSDNTTATITWGQDINTTGTFSISLDDGGSYTASDRFGHSQVIGSWEFTVTEDSSSSTSTSTVDPADLDIVSIPDQLTLVPGNSTAVMVEVENTGVNATDVSTTYDSAPSLTVTQIDTSSFNLQENESQQVTLTLETGDDFTEDGWMNVTFDYNDGSVTGTIPVNAASTGTGITIVDPRSSIDVVQGEQGSANFTVENTGATELSVSASFDQNDSIVSPSNFDLLPAALQTVDVAFNTTSMNIGLYNRTFTLDAGTVNATAAIEVRIQPAEDSKRQAIQQRLKDLEKQFKNLEAKDRSSKIAESISKARESMLIDQNFAKAKELNEKIASDLQETQDKGQGSGMRILKIALLFFAIFLLLMSVAGGGLYYLGYRPSDLGLEPAEEEDTPYEYQRTVEEGESPQGYAAMAQQKADEIRKKIHKKLKELQEPEKDEEDRRPIEKLSFDFD